MIKKKLVGYMDKFPDFNSRGFDIDAYNKQFIESNMIIHARAKEIAYPDHWGGLSVKCAFYGEEFYKSSNALYAVDDQHYLVFNEGKYYSSWIESEQEVESFTVNITPEFAAEFFQSLHASTTELLDNGNHLPRVEPIRFSEKLYHHNSLVTPVLHQIKHLSQQVKANHERITESLFLLLQRLYENQFSTNLEIESVQKCKASTKAEIFERLTRAKDFIYSAYNTDITLAEIAEIACLNQFYFLRQFRKLYKTTPHQFLTQRRMQVAAELLKQSKKNVVEICGDVGFSDIASFSKLFKRTFGLTPLQYRQQHQASMSTCRGFPSALSIF
ncbi:MAG TPA: AraC family transcriptional regulator [Cyclobacteriaceae bacterium]|nr:AraC family transcriptional regulator [Cyclobacteriaceae bacterium]HMV09443.1 AraC family transcriptional regulator [Cyclobacteriaceae bacterium]HMV89470.1 AraC family transcriptional regulator [Cyclobacteriaceae bacterium]HMX02464.1 AraC family transcriptional regulator [Cyclobacteriaceae bacterium]HMX51048.1 AraC family transcriptional regulator [Cyclobacteriaceae bacterium]